MVGIGSETLYIALKNPRGSSISLFVSAFVTMIY